MTDFEKYYNQLNTKQKEAVDAVEGPVMVVAGPGTGKTQILTLRIANILKQTQAGPENILALTFTEAGAKEMRQRLRRLIGPAADRVRLHTYHGFAGAVINEFEDHFPHIARAKQLTDIEAESIVRGILKEKKFYPLRPAGDPELYVGKILHTIGECKKEAWTPEMVAAFAIQEIKNVETSEEWISTRGPTKGKIKAEGLKRIEKCKRTMLFADLYAEYERVKTEQRRMDYDDLIVELIMALRKDELLLHLLQEKFQYILIDEHQDTNDSQNLLVQLIAEFFENPNLFVVGDEKQAIYRFQGASAANFMNFQKRWAGMRIIRLEDNYRSHQHILDASFSMIEQNYAEGELPELRVRLKAGSNRPLRPLDVVIAENDIAADAYLVQELREAIIKNPSQISAVIVRRNVDAQRILALLEQHDISASAERGSDIFQDPVGMLTFSLLEFLADPSKLEALAYCLAGGLWELDIDTRSRLIKSLRAGLVSDIEKEIVELSYLRSEMEHAGALAFLILMGERAGIVKLVERDPLASQIWRGIIGLAQELARENPDSARELIKRLLEYRVSAGSRTIKISIGASNAPVRVMTAHGSKGLEFDNVFIPYCVEEAWLPRARGEYFILPRQAEENDEERDARRLFYVALTRGREHVSVIAPMQEAGRQLTPLRFMYELDPAHVTRHELPAAAETPHLRSVAHPEAKRKLEAVEYAKRILADSGLSVTALNHFCECPAKFFYKSILRLPEPPTAQSEKGNAMHEGMAAAWQVKPKTVVNISKAIEKSVRAYFSTSLLPTYEKEPALESLLADAPVVAEALLPHFSQTGTIATETWQATTFEGLQLRGKLDAVLESADSVAVFDYKTKEGMSVNAIKGETKDGDGNFFRQLVFYKILLQGDSRLAKKVIEPALVFIKPDSKGRCPIVSLPIEPDDIARVKDEIQKLVTSVQSGQFLEDSCQDKECKFCALRRLM